MFNNKQRFAVNKDKIYDPNVSEMLITHNSSKLDKVSRELDKKRYISMMVDKPFNEEHDEADRLGQLITKDFLPLPIDHAHRRLMHTEKKKKEYVERNKKWMEDQTIPFEEISKGTSDRLRTMMSQDGYVKEIIIPTVEHTDEDNQNEVKEIRGLKQVFLQTMPRSLDF